jgi:phosphatidylethanolamine-binding protein (PEBP) family uncharacterized protein
MEKIEFEVLINKLPITDDIYIPKKETQSEPRLIFDKKKSKNKFTIIMVDPDAKQKYWLHWLIINNKKIIAEYHGPNPPEKNKFHRYFFYLYKQQSDSYPDLNELSSLNLSRADFNLAEFVHKHKLEEVANVFFKTKKNV